MGEGGGDGLFILGEGDACPVEGVRKGGREGGREEGERNVDSRQVFRH